MNVAIRRPAGLSAALAISRVLRPCTVIDSHVYRNATSPSAHTLPGAEGIGPAKWRANVRAELEPFVKEGSLTFVDGVVDKASGQDGSFEVGLSSGETVRGRKLLFATGIEDGLPDIPGFKELWGTKIIHCVYCHGYENKGKKLGALLNPGKKFENMAVLEGLTKKFIPRLVTGCPILLNGVDLAAPNDWLMPQHPSKIRQLDLPIYSLTIKALQSTSSGLEVHFFGSSAPLSLDALLAFCTPRIPDAIRALAESLGVNIGIPQGGIPGIDLLMTGENESGKTNVAGVFAAGNCSNVMANVAMSISAGIKAGVTATMELEKDEEVAGGI